MRKCSIFLEFDKIFLLLRLGILQITCYYTTGAFPPGALHHVIESYPNSKYHMEGVS